MANYWARPAWSIPNYWVGLREEGYRGIGPMRWWRGNHRWAARYRQDKILDRMFKDLDIYNPTTHEIDCNYKET